MLFSGARRLSIFACLAVMLQLLAAPMVVRCVDTHGIARLEVGCERDVRSCDHACDGSDSGAPTPPPGPCEDTPAQTLLARSDASKQVATKPSLATPTPHVAELHATHEPRQTNLTAWPLPPRKEPPSQTRTALRAIVLQV
ncbi:MAG: hypothetical protein K2Y21_14170 [Phycisphaerales bacterium]|nr:hypothetical protein [Phycisphaerales bacterium]